MNDLYLALIGDIVESRKIKERENVQRQLQHILDGINCRYCDYIVSKFVITVGDELQGLLLPQAPVYRIISTILEKLYPVKLRFGLGFGFLSTGIINKEMAIGMDGPAFYLAREAVNRAHRCKGYAIAFRSDVIPSSDEADINTYLGLLAVIRNLWNNKFLQIVEFLRMDLKQVEIANKMQVSQPYISELIKQAHWREVKILEEQVGRQLFKHLKYNK